MVIRKAAAFIIALIIAFSGVLWFMPIERAYGIAPEVWIEISNAAGLAGINSDLTANYILVANIDLTEDWVPLGNFTGKLDGNGKIIRGLTISNTTLANAGLFSSIGEGAQVYGLGFEGANITAGDNVGILAGINSGTVERVYAKGSVSGQVNVGGLVGQNDPGASIIDSFASAAVSGRDFVGGIAGTNNGTINDTYSSSNITASVLNNYLEFNGTTGYISIPHHSDYVTGTFTLEAWFQWNDVVKPLGTDPNYYVDFVIGKGVEQFEIHTEGGSGRNGIRFIPIVNVAADSHLDVHNVLKPGWFHVAASNWYDDVSDKAYASFFLNGEAQDIWQKGVNVGKVAEMPRTTPPTISTSEINIGRRTDGSYPFNGKIADVRFWNVVRTEAQIKANKDKKLTGKETGLVGYWKLDEASGSTAVDSVKVDGVSKNNGMLNGGINRVSETGAVHKGGLTGGGTGAINASYYDHTVSTLPDAGDEYARTTGWMKVGGNYTSWDFANTWSWDGAVNNGYPYLRMVETDTRTITGYYADNDTDDTPLNIAASVPYGTLEAAAKAGLSTAGYAKLSDNSYIPVTIDWSFDTEYNGNTAGAKALTGTISGTFPGGQVPEDMTGTVTIEADTRTITGYYADNDTDDTPLNVAVSVPFGTLEAAAKAGLSSAGHAKLSDNSYIPITIDWSFDEEYNGNITGAKALTGTVSGVFPGGQVPEDITGTVTIEADIRTITGYYADNDTDDTPLNVAVSVPFGTLEAAAKAGLSTTGFTKMNDNSYIPITIDWSFDEEYNGNIVGAKALTGTVSGVFPGGQVPEDIMGTVTVESDTRIITGYYSDDNGSDIALTAAVIVSYGTPEAEAKAGLSLAGFAKLSDDSYIPVTISWSFDGPYDGNIIGAKTLTGTVSGTFPGGQVPENITGTVTVSEETTYSIEPISDQYMSALTEGYAAGTQETRALTLRRTGSGDIDNLAVALGGGEDSSFEITQPEKTTLSSGTPETTFTLKAKNGLGEGDYADTVTISADNMTAVIFDVTQEVSGLNAPTILSVEPGDAQVNITWSGVPEAEGYNIYISTDSGNYGEKLDSTNASADSYIADGLDNGTIYYVVVSAYNGEAESDYSSAVSVIPQVSEPGAPELDQPVAGDGSVQLSWEPAVGATEYIIFSRINGTSEYDQELTVTGSVYGSEVTSLENGIMYWFRVRAINDGGYADSEEKSATPGTVPGAPTDVSAEAGNRQAIISFTAPADNGGRPITKYMVVSIPGSITAEGIGSPITISGLSNGTRYTFEVSAVNEFGSSTGTASNQVIPKAPSHGEDDEDNDDEDDQDDGQGTPPTITSGNQGGTLPVTGVGNNAGSTTTVSEGGRIITTITVDDNKVGDILRSSGNGSIITLSSNRGSDTMVGVLNGLTVKNMESREAVLQIKADNVSYTLPASEINIDAVSQNLGQQVELKDITVNITISAPSEDTASIIENTASRNSLQLVVKPVEFEITCTSGGRTVNVSRFNGYVERTIAIPEGVDPSKITTGIVLNSDGTFSHVPTSIVIIDGRYYAKINSLTNSVYSVIWNPVNYKDVENHWAGAAINDMGSRLIVDGSENGKFEPDTQMTRAEFVGAVTKALGLLRTGNGRDVFSDVSNTSKYYDAISIAHEYGIISGYGKGKFGADDRITHEQAMTIIARAMKLTGLRKEIRPGETESVISLSGTEAGPSEWAKESVTICAKTGIIPGRSGEAFTLKAEITRAEAAVIIQRLLQRSGLI